MIEEYPKMGYDEFVARQKARGLEQRSITLTRLDTRLVAFAAVTANTWGTAITITPPAGQEISIRGKVQTSKQMEEAHSIYFRLQDSVPTEIADESEITIQIERTSRDVVTGPAGVYAEFNNLVDPNRYRPPEGIYLRGNDQLQIRVYPNLTTVADNCRLNLQCDLWT